MHTITSADGTLIAYERTGSGPPLVLVGGAFSYRRFCPLCCRSSPEVCRKRIPTGTAIKQRPRFRTPLMIECAPDRRATSSGGKSSR